MHWSHWLRASRRAIETQLLRDSAAPRNSPYVPIHRIFSPLASLTDALAQRNVWAAISVLAAFVTIWTLYAAVTTAGQDVHFDMTEIIAWSREGAFGYPKHPPLIAWIARAWFTVFPRADIAFFLLSFLTVAIGLWFVWLITLRVVPTGATRAAGLVLLTLTPVCTFLALKFNPNSLLIPLWAAATYTFLRSYEDRSALWGALAGIAAAMAVLGKYWSLFLLLAFAVAAIVDCRRRDYWRSPAPWVSIITGGLVLAPHAMWVVSHHFSGYAYAIEAHGHQTNLTLARAILNYLGGGFLYVIAPIAAVLLAARPGRATLLDMIWPSDPTRRFLAVIFWVALLAPVFVALALRTRVDSLWTMSSFAVLPALLLGAKGLAMRRSRAVALVGFAAAFPLVMLALSPFIAIGVHGDERTPYSGQGSLLAREAQRLWNTQTSTPWRFVAGPRQLAWAAEFYAKDAPRALPDFSIQLAPWIDPDAMVRDGWIGLCLAADTDCLDAARDLAKRSTGAQWNEVVVQRRLFGIAGPDVHFAVVVVPSVIVPPSEQVAPNHSVSADEMPGGTFKAHPGVGNAAQRPPRSIADM